MLGSYQFSLDGHYSLGLFFRRRLMISAHIFQNDRMVLTVSQWRPRATTGSMLVDTCIQLPTCLDDTDGVSMATRAITSSMTIHFEILSGVISGTSTAKLG
jgi:hypothetical protein